MLFYSGGIGLDEDLVIQENGKDVFLPRSAAGVMGLFVPIDKRGNDFTYGRPSTIIVYQGKQHRVNLRYLHIEGRLIDFGDGIESAAFVFPRLDQQSGRISKNELGAAIFVSPRLFRGLLAQTYLLDDPLDRFENFKLVHTQSSLLIEDLRNQGMEVPEFVYFNGNQGPIKIWEIEYTGEEEINEEYLDEDYTKYIDWQL